MNDKLEQLIDYISDKFDFESFYDDYKYETVKETIQNSQDALKEDELKDSWDSIKVNIKDLEKYKEYNAMFGTDWSCGFPCMGYVIFDNDFKYVDLIIM